MFVNKCLEFVKWAEGYQKSIMAGLISPGDAVQAGVEGKPVRSLYIMRALPRDTRLCDMIKHLFTYFIVRTLSQNVL